MFGLGDIGLVKGTWWLKSKADPRWDDSGASASVGMFAMPAEVKQRVEELKARLGEPPSDLEWGYMKD